MSHVLKEKLVKYVKTAEMNKQLNKSANKKAEDREVNIVFRDEDGRVYVKAQDSAADVANSNEQNNSVTTSREANKRKTTENSGEKSTKNAERTNVAKSIEEECVVKENRNYQMKPGISKFLIKWQGYAKRQNSKRSAETSARPESMERSKKKQTVNDRKSSKKIKRERLNASDNSTEDPDKEWEVDKIIDYVDDKRDRYFCIRWKGFDSKFDTWEPEKNLSCDDLIEKFMQSRKSKSHVDAEKLRKYPKKAKRSVDEYLRRNSSRKLSERRTKRGGAKKRVR